MDGLSARNLFAGAVGLDAARDGRLGDVGGEGARGSAKWTKRNHTAAVKVRLRFLFTHCTTNRY